MRAGPVASALLGICALMAGPASVQTNLGQETGRGRAPRLADIRTIFVEPIGGDTTGWLANDDLKKELASWGKIKIVAKVSEADAIMGGESTRRTNGAGDFYRAEVFIKDRGTGQKIWSTKKGPDALCGVGGPCMSSPAGTNSKIMSQLKRDWEKCARRR